MTLTRHRSMFDRKLPNPRPIPVPASRLRYRLETLFGVTGLKMSQYRDSWSDSIFACLNVVWRPHLLAILIFEVYHTLLISEDIAHATFVGYGLRLQYRYQRE